MLDIKGMTGFPSPCAEYAEEELSWESRYIANEPATFHVKISSDQRQFELKKGDHLIIDRSLDPKPGELVVAVINNEFKIAQFTLAASGEGILMPFNKKVGDVEAEEDFIWGVVSSLHRKFRA
ncbi:LexA family protein [Peredibacter sp. HCB2-198]|uniref:LexA family protein n=1 Tax=Peredibacter sp. HCB2-198 TaxID=3383025 RepID=UPI0038B41CCB